ncbi:putative tail protein [Escherichia phage vB_EcoS_fFiEco02]|uniref:putative tail protein n=1 Tax=Escherichia phage vB_EcoS_fFiEco02 TaxID=2762426 RepID=UPI001861E29C|nr:putative tail protein [Escherichia phage vB_EcoS_fFiEco02]QNO11593.1 putative tail protein [Escherichia phage vB_EcoS_fFiEco02]
MEFVVNRIPDGVPVRVYLGEIGDDTDVTDDFEALKDEDAVYHIVEGAGGGALVVGALVALVVVAATVLLTKKPNLAVTATNNQAKSANNSLTDRSNKPRPYERSYDICGTVQTIPNDLMQTYKAFDNIGNLLEYSYYDAGRGHLHIEADGVTEGDTLISDITGSSVAVYAPYTSPNNTTSPQLQIGDVIDQKLYVTYSNDDVDGIVLKAPNDIGANPSADGTAKRISNTGYIYDPSGDSAFSEFLSVGDVAVLSNFDVAGVTNLNGSFEVLYVDDFEVRLAVNGASNWDALTSGQTYTLTERSDTFIGPRDTYDVSLTDWYYMVRGEVDRVLANVAGQNGLYKYDGGYSRANVTVELQYQMIDSQRNPIGDIYTVQGTVTGNSTDYVGTSIYGQLPTASRFRARMRRITNFDKDYDGTVSDEITFINLYGQSLDTTPHYGNRTTVHCTRKQTPRATSIDNPELRMIATEMCYKYLGNGVFDTVMTPNTQAVQSLIRLARDPAVGNLELTTANMDKLLAVQEEIESYFGSELAGQFCYTFDDYDTTMQDIVQTIAEAVFCTAYRKGADIMLRFDRPVAGPEMVFTHRSKTTGTEKWTRTFNDSTTYDSLSFSYIDPDTNVQETIYIPEELGANTEEYESKGVRNYQQAYWLAWRRYQRNALSKVVVEFEATEEGALATPGGVISVVKGSRIAPQDGYVVAVNGLTLTLSQPVTFTPGDDHSIILKKRDGSVQSISVIKGNHDREVIMLSAPEEAIYTGNSALKTEFSFGNEARHNAQKIVVSSIDPGDDRTVKITGYNYDDGFYKYDGVAPYGSGFSDGFSNGFN